MNQFDATGYEFIAKIVVLGSFQYFRLEGNQINHFSGQIQANFSHYTAHDGSKNGPIPEIFISKTC